MAPTCSILKYRGIYLARAGVCAWQDTYNVHLLRGPQVHRYS